VPPTEQVVSTWNAKVAWNAGRTVLTARPAGSATWGLLVRAIGSWTPPVVTCRTA